MLLSESVDALSGDRELFIEGVYAADAITIIPSGRSTHACDTPDARHNIMVTARKNIFFITSSFSGFSPVEQKAAFSMGRYRSTEKKIILSYKSHLLITLGAR